MVELRNPIQFAAVLFAGRDNGQWTLPPSLLAARDAFVRVSALHQEVYGQAPERADDVRERLAAQLAAGADVDAGSVLAAQQATTEYEERVALLKRAREIAENSLAYALRVTAREVIASHLQPAHTTLTDALREDFGRVAHIPGDAPVSVILTAPKPQRDAVVRIDAAVVRYDTLRSAYNLVRKIGGQDETADGYGFFREVRNMEKVWPGITGARPPRPNDVPWPTTSTRDRLGWLFAHGAELWAPTADEQSQRWSEVFGERTERAAANRSNLNAYRGMYEGPVPPSSPTPTSGSERRAAIADRILRAGVQ